jgi:hypothetical protein
MITQALDSTGRAFEAQPSTGLLKSPHGLNIRIWFWLAIGC